MKKLVSVLFALLLVGSFAFADVAVGGWGRFIYSPAASVDGGDNYSFSAPSWASGGRVGFNVVGSSDNAGFKLNVDSNGNTLGVGDNAKIWIKINDMFTIQGGKIQGDVLRGKVDDSGTLNALPIGTGATGKDAIFQRFYPKHGILLDITPAEGMYLGAALDTAVDEDGNIGELTEDTMKKIQVGAGYMIADVGHFRAQYVGNVDDAAKYMNVAFAYTGMEGLLVDVGAKIQMEADVAQHTVALGATYGKDALSAILRANVGIGEDAAGDAMAMGGSVDLSYMVADPLAVGIEVSYQKRDDPYGLGILPYGKMGYGNGYAKAGFLYAMDDDGDDSYSSWAIPIVLEYWF
jgi:hypothetical protein